MRSFTLGLTSLLLLAISPSPLQAESAKQAIHSLKRAKGENAVRNIVAMRGFHGQDQPESWEILTSQPSLRGYSRYLVSGGKLRGEKVSSSAPSSIILRVDKLRLDSTDAFRIANEKAQERYIGFDSIDYELRAVDYSYSPVWRITLRDEKRAPLAHMEISAENGKVRWPQSSQPAAARSQAPVRSSSSRSPSTPHPYEGRPVSERNLNYGEFEGRDYRSGADPVRVRERNYVWWHETTDGLEYAGYNIKEGFKDAGAAFRDIFTGDAVYRSTGKKRTHIRKAAHTRPQVASTKND